MGKSKEILTYRPVHQW